jgi:uncharacterized short protein YbdD (DUF466 family)
MSARLEVIARCWQALRQLAGEDRYERYIEHLRAAHPDRQPPDRREFYRDMLARRWSGISRCC